MPGRWLLKDVKPGRWLMLFFDVMELKALPGENVRVKAS